MLENADWQAVGYRLPVVELLRARPTSTDAVGHLGPDLLGPDWDLDEALRRLAAAPDREIGQALIDQRNLAGIGNLYKAESLFLPGVSPWRRWAMCRPRRGRRAGSHRLLDDQPRRTPRQVTTGDQPPRAGALGLRAARPAVPSVPAPSIVSAEQGAAAPYHRLTYWCPTCQPRAVADRRRNTERPSTPPLTWGGRAVVTKSYPAWPCGG